MAIRPRRLGSNLVQGRRRALRLQTILAAVGVLLFGVAMLASEVLHVRWLARPAGGLAITIIAISALIKTWTDGRAGVIRHRFTDVRERDIPHTFAASVAFHLLVWLIIAAAGIWIFLGAIHAR